ncbi:hypothetical protein LTR48_000141 [Friedmanniomyces endolithicus]|uniref:Phytanoyl-CoA dioxygenase n=1 Tax=Rachicladosporium monterosium TaxID=1507873 RepID=A0ABR0LGJ2_9PEZI|nr:hypothetical protein LTR29_010245 [Friedmanniomyces endolithicus]KAK1089667.1 hypothetical protein LTR48_000141 [Friedmanniomyces endolithicus]KAK1813773.1 hypothetical protein LTR12_011827 [Friedmanniomyces endolithicus]KAK5148447.1 hypothetical protein LTR32_000265 [Rachicladosporium monterosium]
MPYINGDQPALTEAQKEFWLEHGYVKIPQCFTREASDAFTHSIWARLGADPADKSTWPTEKINMPGHTVVSCKDFAPKAWAAMCELVGGEDKVADFCKDWKDGFIPNFGKPEYSPDDELDLRTLDNWHNDGDWFVHFLDSPEQALLVIPLFSDIKPKGGGTVLCTDGVGLVARLLHEQTNGCLPNLMPRGTPDLPKDHPDRRRIWNSWVRDPSLTRDESFCEATGEIGDVYLLHPFMLHSASRNLRREVRIITNPPVSLKEPFCYDGRSPSLVEQKTLRELGREGGMPEWKITAARERLVPDRIRIQEEMKRKEMENLKSKGVAVTTLEGARELSDEYPS